MNEEAKSSWIYIIKMHGLTLAFDELAGERRGEEWGNETDIIFVDSKCLVVGVDSFMGVGTGSGGGMLVYRYDNRNHGLRGAMINCQEAS